MLSINFLSHTCRRCRYARPVRIFFAIYAKLRPARSPASQAASQPGLGKPERVACPAPTACTFKVNDFFINFRAAFAQIQSSGVKLARALCASARLSRSRAAATASPKASQTERNRSLSLDISKFESHAVRFQAIQTERIQASQGFSDREKSAPFA